MKISRLIEILQSTKDRWGDVPVHVRDLFGEFTEADYVSVKLMQDNNKDSAIVKIT